MRTLAIGQSWSRRAGPASQGSEFVDRSSQKLFGSFCQHRKSFSTLTGHELGADVISKPTMSLNIPSAPNAGLFKNGYNKYVGWKTVRLKTDCERT